jgi:hypothetical protein
VALANSTIDNCGQYGVGADGVEVVVDLRDCTIEACKFENTDQRNGGRVVGYQGQD